MSVEQFRKLEANAHQSFEASPYPVTWGLSVLDAWGTVAMEAGNYGANTRFPAGAISNLAIARALDVTPVDLAETASRKLEDVIGPQQPGPAVFLEEGAEMSRAVLAEGMLRWGDDLAGRMLVRSLGGYKAVLDVLRAEPAFKDVNVRRLLTRPEGLDGIEGYESVFFPGHIVPREGAALLQQALKNPHYNRVLSRNIHAASGLAAALQLNLDSQWLRYGMGLADSEGTLKRLAAVMRGERLPASQVEIMFKEPHLFTRHPNVFSHSGPAAGEVAEIGAYTVALMVGGWPFKRGRYNPMCHPEFRQLAAPIGEFVWRMQH
ncbi:MAG TPA: hypothetical protein VLF71_05035 [Candidatus Saccharimonadales bacterium]|nr:hypothetical protein [Candidatus Saccharimonadales bacterium]